MSSIKLYPPKPSKVYFYGTCLVDMFYPDAGMAGIQLLEREGIEVIYPQDQTCCGQPAYTSGYHDQARDVAAAQLTLFPQDYLIVLPSGSCAGMMREHYPELFAGHPEEALAKNVASRIFELTEFLMHICHIKLEDKGEPMKVAMHTSCTARREMGLGDVGPALLNQLDNVEVVEQARIKECCGFGGAFSVRHPEISEAMVTDKVEAIDASGAKAMISSDCGEKNKA
jgi:L-lactate dehydrogenase complex protein LldE